MTARVIIDTDAGDDPDDALALTLAMHSPELLIEGITTVHGDVLWRAELVRELLRLGGREEVPVHPGIARSLLWNRRL